MSNQTLFFVLGISLVVVALVVSFVGLRFDKFPASRAAPDRRHRSRSRCSSGRR